MLQLRKYKHDDYNALNSYQLDAKQARFTADIDYCINQRKDLEDKDKTIIVIVFDNQVVGFFVLDRGKVTHNLTDNPKAVTIRCLSVNPDYQGKGIGKQAMQSIPQFLRQNASEINEIVLSVNAKNTLAYHVYQQSGYIDTGKIIDGPMGKQRVFSLMVYNI